MGFRLGDVGDVGGLKARVEDWKRKCREKIHHPTPARALSQIAQVYGDGRAERGTLHTYKCPWCDRGWLVGHLRGKALERRRGMVPESA